MTDLCEKIATELIDSFGLTPETAWTWSQRYQRWQFLENKIEEDDDDENFLLRVKIGETIAEFVRNLDLAQLYAHLQSTQYNVFESDYVYVDWTGYSFESTIEVLQMLLEQTIEGIFVDLIPKPALTVS